MITSTVKTNWTTKNWPDWCDVGKLVEVELENGSVVTGTLIADDWYDVPLFEILLDNKVVHSFAANKRWRFATP